MRGTAWVVRKSRFRIARLRKMDGTLEMNRLFSCSLSLYQMMGQSCGRVHVLIRLNQTNNQN